jgi:hypothetical protein
MNYQVITNEIWQLDDESNVWSSTIVIRDGDNFLDISFAAMGESSFVPVDATKQPGVYQKGKAVPVYQFDPDTYYENSWQKLKFMMTKNGCVGGCRLVLRCTDMRITHQWKACYKLWCSH